MTPTPAVQAPAPAPAILKFVAMGELAEPPQMRTRTDGRLQLTLVLAQRVPQHLQAVPFVAEWLVEDHGAPHAAAQSLRDRARLIQECGGAVVVAMGVELGTWRGAPCLRAIDCMGVEARTDTDPYPLAAAARQAEPQEA